MEKQALQSSKTEEGGTMDLDKEQVVAIYINDLVSCTNCMKDEDWNSLTQERVITREEKDEKDKIFFCDRCGEPI
ncbi:MAG: hypothetical protein ACLFPI_04755 [Desulfobacterales bacterium]